MVRSPPCQPCPSSLGACVGTPCGGGLGFITCKVKGQQVEFFLAWPSGPMLGKGPERTIAEVEDLTGRGFVHLTLSVAQNLVHNNYIIVTGDYNAPLKVKLEVGKGS